MSGSAVPVGTFLELALPFDRWLWAPPRTRPSERAGATRPRRCGGGTRRAVRRSPQSKIVRSREPAHPAIVSVDVFTRVQLEIRARRGADMAARASQPRTRVGQKTAYLFRGAICC